MSAFTPAEIAYLRDQLLGRLATVGPNGQPHVVPVAFRYSGETDAIDIGGYDFAKRQKYRDVGGNPRGALVIDDVPSVNPWRARGIEIRGVAKILETGGGRLVPSFAPPMFRILPRARVSWGGEGGSV